MKKLESINSLKFDKFKETQLVNLSQILGGNIASGADSNGCTDSFDWTARTVNGASYNAMDNIVWTCPALRDTL